MRLLTGLALAFLFLCPALTAQAETLVLGTLDWPPFVGQELPGQGEFALRVQSACKAAGLDLQLSFLPWKRVLLSMRSGVIQGFFPEYLSEEGRRHYSFSRPLGCSVVGLVHRRDHPVEWTRLEDLAGLSIGVVDGYVNSGEFDALAERGVLQTVKCNADILALRMVGAGRIDAAVVDRDVFLHLVRSGAISAQGDELVFSPRPLAVHTLHVCFPRTPEGAELAARFDRAAGSAGLVQDCLLP